MNSNLFSWQALCYIMARGTDNTFSRPKYIARIEEALYCYLVWLDCFLQVVDTSFLAKPSSQFISWCFFEWNSINLEKEFVIYCTLLQIFSSSSFCEFSKFLKAFFTNHSFKNILEAAWREKPYRQLQERQNFYILEIYYSKYD